MKPEKLIEHARKAREKAYAPYSGFAVGAALLDESGVVVEGCNIENASYGLSNCAERTALFRAWAEGRRKFVALAVVADSPRPVPPCGACRQVLIEFCPPDMPVYLSNLRGEVRTTTVGELLPGAFAANDLQKDG